VPADTVAAFAELVFAYIDELSAASVAGHADELETSGRARQRYLDRLVSGLLRGDAADALVSAYCGAARTTTVHGDSAAMEAGETAPQTPVAVPANSVVSLTPAKGHIMLDRLTGPLAAGDTVSLLLRFEKAGQVLVDVPVIANGAPS